MADLIVKGYFETVCAAAPVLLRWNAARVLPNEAWANALRDSRHDCARCENTKYTRSLPALCPNVRLPSLFNQQAKRRRMLQEKKRKLEIQKNVSQPVCTRGVCVYAGGPRLIELLVCNSHPCSRRQYNHLRIYCGVHAYNCTPCVVRLFLPVRRRVHASVADHRDFRPAATPRRQYKRAMCSRCQCRSKLAWQDLRSEQRA